jgi:hypothetical protein
MPSAVGRSPHDFSDVAAVAGWYNAASGRAHPDGELHSSVSESGFGDGQAYLNFASCRCDYSGRIDLWSGLLVVRLPSNESGVS